MRAFAKQFIFQDSNLSITATFKGRLPLIICEINIPCFIIFIESSIPSIIFVTYKLQFFKIIL